MTAMAALYILAVACAFGAVLVATIMYSARNRKVTCPETGTEVEVDCDPMQAVKATFVGGDQRVVACERWPERRDCARQCEVDLGPKI